MTNNQLSKYKIFNIKEAAQEHNLDLNLVPFSIRVLMENAIRHNYDNINCIIKKYRDNEQLDEAIDFFPARVLMQDFTGVPAVVDLATMRDTILEAGGNPSVVNPKIPVDLVIDHSVQVDRYGTNTAFDENTEIEFARNNERYNFLKWGQASLSNFRVVPPGTGICHQVNLEYLAEVVFTSDNIAYPDTLVGTDSHTTMVNALGVLGWGVGGIEAEAAMLGEPLPMQLPEVVGVELVGSLPEGVTATDLVLTITQKLRALVVVGKFVEFYGSGLKSLSLADRATISNMAPEYGATCGFFPVDEEVINYLKLSGKSYEKIDLCEQYCRAQSLWYDHSTTNIVYDEKLTINLSEIELSLAGPRRPQDRVPLTQLSKNFASNLSSLNKNPTNEGQTFGELQNGSVVISAITSCTNTSNPFAMVAAGLFAKKAVELGLQTKPWVKTSFAPGSQVVSGYLQKAGLQQYLDQLGFNLVGYGCTTCIGNSGHLKPEIEQVIADNQLVVASVLSGNRNFEGRIHPLVRANYLAAPFLCVAYAIAGDINIDLATQAIGTDKSGNPVYLHQLIPNREEINSIINQFITRDIFIEKYKSVFDGDKNWQAINIKPSEIYEWDTSSTYIRKAPYFESNDSSLRNISNAKILAIFGDSITTDHISPAGNIAKNSPAARYLIDNGVQINDFNSYGARRGNHEVMMRGTFANVRIRNKIVPEVEGGYTKYNGEVLSIYDAAQKYKADKAPLVIFAGKEYGTGSSRDWAAKGTALLGVKAVIAESFERIHRSNLVGMGVIPLLIKQPVDDLNLNGTETIEILGLEVHLEPMQTIQCKIGGKTIDLVLNVKTERELEYLRAGGIMQYVINNIQ